MREGERGVARVQGLGDRPDEVTEREFNGEDVLRPKLQQLFDDTRRRLEKLAIVAASYDDSFEFDEPPEQTMTEIRELIEKAVGR